jgi:hypothetical protein
MIIFDVFLALTDIYGVNFITDWCDLKSVGNMDCANTNESFRLLWLKKLEYSRLYGDIGNLLCHVTLLDDISFFKEWIIDKKVFYVSDFSKYEFLNAKLFSKEFENLNDEADFNDSCSESESSYGNKLTDDKINFALIMRSLKNMQSEIRFIASSSLKLGDKIQRYIDESQLSDEIICKRTVYKMCEVAVSANRMVTIAVGRFSELVNTLLLSTFIDDQIPIESVVSTVSAYSTTYVSVGLTDVWSKSEDRNLIRLINNSDYDYLTITAHLNVRLLFSFKFILLI